MDARLRYVLALYFAEHNITNKVAKAQYSIEFVRLTQDGRTLFTITVQGRSFHYYVTRKLITFDNLLTIAKTFSPHTVDKYFIMNVVSQYTQGFNHQDVGLITYDNDNFHIQISPGSYCYTGNIHIRRV